MEHENLFALYWNQPVAFVDGYIETIHEHNISLISYLQLKPLSSISDEDKEWLQDAFTKYYPKIVFGSNQLSALIKCYEDDYRDYPEYYAQFNTLISDYLRSKGYALPYLDITVEEQVKRGWIKLV